MAQRAAEEGISESTLRRRLQNAKPEPESEEVINWRARKERAEALKAERFLEMLDGEYYPRAEVDRQQAVIAHLVNALFRAIPAELSSILAGLTAEQIEKRSKEWTCDWADKFRDAQSALWTEALNAMVKDARGDVRKIAEAKKRRSRKK